MREFGKVAAVSIVALCLSGCDMLGSNTQAENKVTTVTKTSNAASRLCGANATYSRLKQAAFDEAKRIRERDTESLDALADASIVRMENPLLESRDDALGLTVCSGRMIVELPPGAGAAFDGRQRLAADITYSAQAAADGSGTVFKIDGGEPIVYRLAGFDPDRSATRTASASPLVIRATPERPAEPVSAPAPPPTEPSEAATAPSRDVAAERARATALRQEQAARAATARDARAAREAAAGARAEGALAAERSARATRVAEARRTERGERDLEPRTTGSTARPSFSCRYARSRVEKLVCGSNDLAERDRRMANVYYRANDRADARTRRALSASRLRFLAYRDRCGNEACVAGAYEDRIDEINDIAGD